MKVLPDTSRTHPATRAIAMMSKLPRLLAGAVLVALAAGTLPAQYHNLTCVVHIEGQNRNRTVDGEIGKECGGWRGGFHSAPWGNWGVDSNYGDRRDEDQFRGWKRMGSMYHWNSCTKSDGDYAPPDRRYYNTPPDFRSQHSRRTVTHGIMSVRRSVECVEPWDPRPPMPRGCSSFEGDVYEEDSNHMKVYELDRPDGDDLIEIMAFPGTSVRLQGCDYDGCPEQTSEWVRLAPSTSSVRHLGAELRMKASARIWGSCNWDWMP